MRCQCRSLIGQLVSVNTRAEIYSVRISLNVILCVCVSSGQMHELTVMDKEKEHMSRLKDAVDMKVGVLILSEEVRPTDGMMAHMVAHMVARMVGHMVGHMVSHVSAAVFYRELWRSRWRTTERFTRSS